MYKRSASEELCHRIRCFHDGIAWSVMMEQEVKYLCDLKYPTKRQLVRAYLKEVKRRLDAVVLGWFVRPRHN